MKPRTILICFAIFVVVTSTISAENTSGLVTGRVASRSGDIIVGANIVVSNMPVGTSTDLDGQFKLELPTGMYALVVSAVGYENVTLTDVMVRSARPNEIEILLNETVLELEEVRFSGGFFRRRTDTPISLTVQTNEEIRRLPGGFEDVLRAVALSSGVAQISPGRNDLIVRGGAATENLYILDNIELANINHFGTQGTGGGPQSYVNLDFIEQVSFSAGGFGARYGDRLSSVLTLKLRSPRSDRFGGKTTISASQFGLNLEGPFNWGSGGYFTSIRRSYLDLIFKAAGFAFVPEFWDFLLKVEQDIDPKNKISITGLGAIDRVRLFNDNPDQRYQNSTILGVSQDQFVGGVTWKHFVGKGYFQLTGSESFVRYNGGQLDSTLADIFKTQSTENETGIATSFNSNIRPGSFFTVGGQIKQLKIEADQFLKPFTTPYGETISIDTTRNAKEFKYSLFTNLEQRLGFLRIGIGLRFDHFTLVKDGTRFQPRLSFSYPLTGFSNIVASVGKYYQSPSMIWLVSNVENRKLKPLGADHFILGIDQLLRKDMQIKLEGYYKRYFDYPVSSLRPYLVMANVGGSFGGTDDGFSSFGFDKLISTGKGWSRGAELLVQKRIVDHAHYGTASLTWSETRFTGSDGIERPGAFDQRWIFNLGWGFMFKQQWEIAGKFRVVSGRPFTPYDDNGNQDIEYFHTERVEVNHSLDVRIDRIWNYQTSTLVAYIDVQNVYNSTPHDIPRWDERKKQAIEPSGIGILPTIGISYEF